MDPSLATLFSGGHLPWTDIFEFLLRKYNKTCRVLQEPGLNGCRHILLFNPANSDYYLHFVLSLATTDAEDTPTPNGTLVDVFSVSREGVADPIEYAHISSIVNDVSYWMWRACVI